MKYKEFYDELLNMQLVFLTDCNPVQREEFLTKKFKGLQSDLSGQFGAFTSTIELEGKGGTKQTKYIIWVGEKDDFYALLHELVHLNKRVFVDRGIPFNETNDEMMAYWLEHWFKVLWRFMNKKVAKVK